MKHPALRHSQLSLAAAAVTPVPPALALFTTALAGLGFAGWRHRKTAALASFNRLSRVESAICRRRGVGRVGLCSGALAVPAPSPAYSGMQSFCAGPCSRIPRKRRTLPGTYGNRFVLDPNFMVN